MARTIKMTFSLPTDIAEFIGALASKREQPRSVVVAAVLEEKRRQLFEEELARAYLEMGDEDREFARQAFPLAAETWPRYDDAAPGDR